ncbi:MAG: DNA gyrase subunit A [Holosporales bacterium]|jgi:DNA gyrase subunit A|nr:DNA gyrase subunit A [Holosporales bacterium]
MSEKDFDLFSSDSDVKVVSLEEEMKGAYLDYAMSVIVSRALPDVRDGLKPVQRRILYVMDENGHDYNKPRRKSATVVGAVQGNYHPHGNDAIYGAMVRMAQDFSMGITLVDGQGNFGSLDGDPPAAFRYTEVRLSKISRELLDDIHCDTVDFRPNYDNSKQEPTVLPAKFPNLLINGSNGIAVGMATYVPTHNLGEVIDACCALIDDPDLTVDDLIKYVPGPDFPTGATIMGRGGIYQAYKTGRGTAIVRSKSHIEEIRGGREAIVITEIPFQVNKASMIERIADLVKEKIITDISNIRDESDKDGVRVVIELRKDAVADVVLNQLYRFSSVQTNINFNMLALVYGRPEQLSLKSILSAFLMFREDVVRRRTRFEWTNARERVHVLVGFAVALANLDEVISLIRNAPDRATAKSQLLERKWKADDIVPLLELVEDVEDREQDTYSLSITQADAILDLRLHRLTGLEQKKIHDELSELAATIQHLLELLQSRQKILELMKADLLDLKKKYATPRKTVIEESSAACEDEDLIQREGMVVTVSLEGFIKRVPLDTYRSQKRGGRGRSGMTTKSEDVVNDVIVASTHDDILFFSTLGRVYSLKVYQLPLGTPQSKGRAMVNLFTMGENEKISTVLILPDNENHEDKYLMFATSLGNIRRNKISDFARIASNGKRAMNLDENELLIGVVLAHETDDVFISTTKGMANRFPVSSVRIFAGRESNGVRAIRLDEGDAVTNISIISSNSISSEERDAYYKLSSKLKDEGNPDADPDLFSSETTEDVSISDARYRELAANEQFVLTVTENGFGKRTSAYAYRTTNRGTKGVSNITMNARNGDVVSSFPVKEDDDVMLVTNLGQLIRCPVKDIRITRRMAQGVIIFKVGDGEKVVAVSRVPSDAGDLSD